MSSSIITKNKLPRCKHRGIINAFSSISCEDEYIETVELGIKYLSHLLKARMSGVASEPEESYGIFAVQAAGFAGLSLAEAIKADSVFNLEVKS